MALGYATGSGSCTARPRCVQERVQVLGDEAGVLEVAEEAEIADQADDEPELARPLARAPSRGPSGNRSPRCRRAAGDTRGSTSRRTCTRRSSTRCSSTGCFGGQAGRPGRRSGRRRRRPRCGKQHVFSSKVSDAMPPVDREVILLPSRAALRTQRKPMASRARQASEKPGVSPIR